MRRPGVIPAFFLGASRAAGGQTADVRPRRSFTETTVPDD